MTSEITRKTYQSTLNRVEKDVRTFCEKTGNRTDWGWVVPVVGLKSHWISKATSRRVISVLKGVKEGRISTSGCKGWMADQQGIERLGDVAGDFQRNMDLGRQEALREIEGIGKQEKGVVDAILYGDKKEANKTARRRQKKIDRRWIRKIETFCGDDRRAWFEEIQANRFSWQSVALMIRPTYLTGARTSELFGARLLLGNTAISKDYSQDEILSDIGQAVEDGVYADVALFGQEEAGIEEILENAREYVAAIGHLLPPVMEIRTRKQGHAREDRRQECRHLVMWGIDQEDLDALVYLSMLRFEMARGDEDWDQTGRFLHDEVATKLQMRVSRAIGKLSTKMQIKNGMKVELMELRHAFATRTKAALSMEEAAVLQGHLITKTTSGYGGRYKRKKRGGQSGSGESGWVPRADPARMQAFREMTLERGASPARPEKPEATGPDGP